MAPRRFSPLPRRALARPTSTAWPGSTSPSTPAALKLGDAAAAPAPEGHADLEARFDFDCKQGGRAASVEVGLFEAFKRLQRLDLQLATPRGQMKAVLQRPASRVALVR